MVQMFPGHWENLTTNETVAATTLAVAIRNI